MDCIDLSAALKGTGPSPRNEIFYYWDSELRAIRKGRYKAHFITSGAYGEGEPRTPHTPPLLFDLAADPGESNDLSERDPDKLAEMIKLWDDYAKTNGVIY